MKKKEPFFKNWRPRVSFSVVLSNEDYEKLMSIAKREWKDDSARKWLAGVIPIDQLTVEGFSA